MAPDHYAEFRQYHHAPLISNLIAGHTHKLWYADAGRGRVFTDHYRLLVAAKEFCGRHCEFGEVTCVGSCLIRKEPATTSWAGSSESPQEHDLKSPSLFQGFSRNFWMYEYRSFSASGRSSYTI